MKLKTVIQIILFSLCSSLVMAGSDSVFLGKKLCTQNNTICIKGSMEYNYSNGKLLFHGRVKKTTKAGIFVIDMEGITRKNELIRVHLQGSLKGKYSEIVRIESGKIIRNRRDIKWKIKAFGYHI